MAASVRRIVLISAGLAAIAAAVIVFPLARHFPVAWPGTLPLTVAAERGHLPAGLVLSPCRPRDELRSAVQGVDEAFQTAQAFGPRVESEVFPSWGGAPWKIQLYDRDGRSYVRVIGFDAEQWRGRYLEPLQPGKPAVIPPARVTEVAVSADTADKLEAEWQRSIRAAVVHDDIGADGTTYFFRAGQGCARTWSPAAESRNFQLTGLLHAMAEGLDEAELRRQLAVIPPPPLTTPWPPEADSTP